MDYGGYPISINDAYSVAEEAGLNKSLMVHEDWEPTKV